MSDEQKKKGAVELEQLRDNYDDETAISLGANLCINSVEFPPPTTAVVSFLDLIRSPFIVAGIKPALQDIFNALFVLKHKHNAVRHMQGAFAAKRNVEIFTEHISKGSEYLDVVMTHSDRYEKELSAFYNMAAEFGEKLGVFNINEISQKIENYISSCFNGWEMIPRAKSEFDGDKKKDLIVNG